MRKQVVIDIDGILWTLGEHWYTELIKINPECPFPGLTNWAFFEGYMSEEEALGAVKKVHMNQDSENYEPFPSACKLTHMLNRANYKIVIASHRDPESYDATAKWLGRNMFHYDELYTGPDKHPYLDDPNTVLFIDDSPSSQQYALDRGVDTYSIRYSYNEHVEDVNFFDDFEDLLVNGIREWIVKDGNLEQYLEV